MFSHDDEYLCELCQGNGWHWAPTHIGCGQYQNDNSEPCGLCLGTGLGMRGLILEGFMTPPKGGYGVTVLSMAELN